MKAVTALSPTSTLLAVYTPTLTPTSNDGSMIQNKMRLVVKCYDSKVSMGTLKFTLVANLDTDESVSDGSISQLFFCGSANHDNFLILTLPTRSNSQLIVWDLKRGVTSHRIDVPRNCYLCQAVANESYNQHHCLYALVKNLESSKLTVYVHDLETESGKIIQKVKIGACPDIDDHSTRPITGIALKQEHNDSSKTLLAVRYGKRIKIIPLVKDGNGGDVIKWKIKKLDAIDSSYSKSDKNNTRNTAFSDSGNMIITTHSDGVHFYSTDGNKKGTATSLISSTPVHEESYKLNVQVYSSHNISQNKGVVGDGGDIVLVTAEQAVTGEFKCYLFEVKEQNFGKKMKHFANITSPSIGKDDNNVKEKKMYQVIMPSGSRGRHNLLLLKLTPRGISGEVDVSLSEVQYREKDSIDDELANRSGSLFSGELYPEQNEKEKSHDGSQNLTSISKKRKAGVSLDKNVVLGPGEGGAEALNVTNSTTKYRQQLKKSKKNKKRDAESSMNDKNEDNHKEIDFDLTEEEQSYEKEGNDGTTIAERLAQLSSQLDRDSDDEGDEDELLLSNLSSSNNIAISAKEQFDKMKCTSDSLGTLLRQALLSNDDTQLEVALKVLDKKVIENSIRTLCEESISTAADKDEDSFYSENNLIMKLLSKLTTRLSRKASRAETLCFWVSTTLVNLISLSSIGGENSNSWMKMGKIERDVAAHLGPLRNMLSERVESLPLLMKLEGRLGFLGKCI